MKLIQALLFSLLAAIPLVVSAQLSIEITGAGANRIPIAVANFEGDRILAQALTSVIRADLDRSGLFRLVDTGNTVLAENALLNFSDWRDLGADAVVSGSLLSQAAGRYETRYRLQDVAKQSLLDIGAFGHSSTPTQLRATAHRIADLIYEKLTGERGIFSTRIAYVMKSTGRYELKVADADGANPQTALASHEPLISPSWSPDGSKLAYVSFELKKPVIYVHDLAANRRHVVANFKGSNSAPAWSPDGKRLAIVLTKDGNSQMYLVNADGSGAKRLANSAGIDTEPQFSPDGQVIYFTSDRGGSPQIYSIPATGGATTRITFDGSYNVTPRPSPDGKSLAFISQNGGRFQLTLMDLATRQTQVLTDSSKDESPSFAPNGRMILYATEVGGRGVLAAVSVDGRVKQKLSVPAADIREPAWSPFVK
ncbi:MAG: Tol-Pal system beta propeller repeat protein TolB [Georgfuchsia sp.]